MTKIILSDIEGTTSSIHFVKDVLFPYATLQLPDFIRRHQQQTDIQSLLADTAALASAEGQQLNASDTEALIAVLLGWIAADKKATPLKTLQGLIWRQGYEQGDYKAHLYPDAGRVLLQWYLKGLPLYLYSSGSVEAQRLFFAYNEAGNLLPLFEGFFDTHIGSKRETSSYQAILAKLQEKHDINAADVLFLSDIKEELDAAKAAGMQTYWLVREGDLPHNPSHPVARSFAEIK